MANIHQIEANRRSLQEATGSSSVEGEPDPGFTAAKGPPPQIGFVTPHFAIADCPLRLAASPRKLASLCAG